MLAMKMLQLLLLWKSLLKLGQLSSVQRVRIELAAVSQVLIDCADALNR